MEKRYRALRIVATLYKILGGIVLVFVLLAAIGVCLAGVIGGSALEQYSRQMGGDLSGMGGFGSAIGGILAATGLLIGGGLSGLSFFAIGEGISLLIAVEENTRAAALHASQAVFSAPRPAAGQQVAAQPPASFPPSGA